MHVCFDVVNEAVDARTISDSICTKALIISYCIIWWELKFVALTSLVIDLVVWIMVSRCILADSYTSFYWHEQLMPNRLCPYVVFSLSKGNGIEDLCRWPAQQLNTVRNIEEQILKGSGEQGVGLHWVGAFGTPAGAGRGAIVLPTLLPAMLTGLGDRDHPLLKIPGCSSHVLSDLGF